MQAGIRFVLCMAFDTLDFCFPFFIINEGFVCSGLFFIKLVLFICGLVQRATD